MNSKKKSSSDETHNFTPTDKSINELNIKLKLNNIRIKLVKDIMDSYTKKTRDELIAICKERKIKGYSSMKKDEIIQLLNPTTTNISISVITPTLKMIDLFAGTGAFTNAFEKKGNVECVFSNDMV